MISLTHPLAYALGWTLLHLCWQAAVVAILLACLLALLPNRAPQLRHAASLSALILVSLLPILTFQHLAAEIRPVTQAAPAQIQYFATSTVLAAQPSPTTFPAHLAQLCDEAMPCLLALWSAGVLLFLARLNLGLLAARRIRSAATQPAPTSLVHTFQTLTHRLEITRPVQLLTSALVEVPTVIGWLRPAVLLPIGCLTGLSSLQIEAILAHELAHIRRHDYLVSVFQSLVEAVLFYHPAVWWISRQLRRERELCCDDLAVHLTGDRLAYARALTFLETSRAALPAPALAATGGVLTMRIRRLLGIQPNPAASQLAALTLLAVVVLTAALGLIRTAHAEPGMPPAAATTLNPSPTIQAQIEPTPKPAAQPIPRPAPVAQPAATPLPKPYQTWLDQDVLWIITPAEQSAFLKLSSDDARDAFITHFWQSRNRDEHYRRLAYANQHFAADAPGWQTDRGHVYITYGPPDSIDSHPAGEPAFEDWSYRQVPGAPQPTGLRLRFFDYCHCGNYRLPVSVNPVDIHFKPAPETPLASNSQILCQLKVVGNQSIPTASLLDSLSSRQGALYSPAAAEQDFNFLWNTGHFQDIRIERKETPTCVQLTVFLQEKPAIQGVSYSPPVPVKLDLSDQALLDQGLAALDKGNYDLARLRLQTLLNQYPDSQLRTRATFALGEAWDGQPGAAALANAEAEYRQAGIRPVELTRGVSSPILTYRVDPQYTEQARQDKIQGKVLLNLWVDDQGRPTHIRALNGPGDDLGDKAIEAVMQYKFKPAMQNGKPVLVAINIEVNFQLF